MFVFTSIKNRDNHYQKHVIKQREPFDKIPNHQDNVPVDAPEKYERLACLNIYESTYIYPAKDSEFGNPNMGYISVYPEIQPLTIMRTHSEGYNKIITFYIPTATHIELFFLCNLILSEEKQLAVFKDNLEPFMILNNRTTVQNLGDTLFCDLLFNIYKQFGVEGDYRIKDRIQKLFHLFCIKEEKTLRNKNLTYNNRLLYKFIKTEIELNNDISKTGLNKSELEELFGFLDNTDNYGQLKLLSKIKDMEDLEAIPLFVYFEYYLQTVLMSLLSSKINKQYKRIDLEEYFIDEVKEYGNSIKELLLKLIG